MSRKDTILIAVLVNVGVLIVLFLSAIKHQPVIVSQSGLETTVANEQTKNEPLDPVDAVLTQYEQKKETETIKEKPVVIQPEKNPVELNKVIAEKTENIAPTFNNEIHEIIVKNGDFLERIAKEHNTTVSELKKLNQLTSNTLKVGQSLFVPKNKVLKIESPQSVKEKFYVVKNGDSPWTIAKKNNIRLEELLMLNNLNEAKAKKLKPGDRLRIQ